MLKIMLRTCCVQSSRPVCFFNDLERCALTDIRHETDTRPRTLRSAVTNGRRRHVEGDGNSAWSRRQYDLSLMFADDLGGANSLSGFQRSLVTTAASLRVALEQMEGKMSKGEEVDVEGYARIASHYRRICESLGIERKAKDITPDLDVYLAGKGMRAGG